MCHDGPCPVQKNHRKTRGMKTLKMCFGKGRLKQRESIEQGKVYLQFVFYYNCDNNYFISCYFNIRYKNIMFLIITIIV